MRQRFLLGLVFGAWLFAVGAGLSTLKKNAARPGDPGAPPSIRPVDSRTPFDAERATLLIFLHPNCPCSRASLEELNRIAARCGGRLAIRAVVVRPRGSIERRLNESILGQARDIPDLRIVDDPKGSEARRFGAKTSGHVLLYDTRGNLRFSGGITPSRDHRGDNRGRDAVVDLVLQNRSRIVRTPVFGCPLFDDDKSSTTAQASNP